MYHKVFQKYFIVYKLSSTFDLTVDHDGVNSIVILHVYAI